VRFIARDSSDRNSGTLTDKFKTGSTRMVASDDMEPEYFTQMAAPTIEEIAEAHPDVVEDIRGLDPVLTAAAFGCLLSMPELQANCFRIQALVHLALAFGEGTGAPTKELIAEQSSVWDTEYAGGWRTPRRMYLHPGLVQVRETRVFCAGLHNQIGYV